METPVPPPPSRLGATWDENLVKQGIIRLTDVSPGSAAERAGLRIGDRILKLDAHSVTDASDFRTLLVTAEQQVGIVVERAGDAAPITLRAELDGEPWRIGITWRWDEAEPGCVILTQVVPGSPADLAGLQPGDRIHAVSDRSFATSDEFYHLATELPSPLTLTVERTGRIRPVVIRLTR
jgi:regulator of sigma E protease